MPQEDFCLACCSKIPVLQWPHSPFIPVTQAEGTSRQIDCKAFTTGMFVQYEEEGYRRGGLPAGPALTCLPESGLCWCRSPLGNVLACLPPLWTAVKGMGQARGEKMLTVACLLNLAIKETPKPIKQKIQTTNQKNPQTNKGRSHSIY